MAEQGMCGTKQKMVDVGGQPEKPDGFLWPLSDVPLASLVIRSSFPVSIKDMPQSPPAVSTQHRIYTN
jgi:hypothetical protein